MLLGVDIGGTKCALVSAENDGKIRKKVVFATSDVKTTLNRICSDTRKLAEENSIEAVGISCGGPLDAQKGEILSPPNLPGWDKVPITALLTEATGAPAFLCNDANACALAEWKYGAGIGCNNMIFLTFGTGMGAGLILNGRLYEGANGLAGEAGHMRITEDGPLGYGKNGSFEGYCSGGGIANLGKAIAANAIKNGSPLWWCKDYDAIDKITSKTVAEAALNGDESAQKIYEISAKKLGLGLSILIDLFNPERIIIGSVFTRAEKLFRKTMEEVISEEALPEAAGVCKILPAALGDAIGDFAAVAVAQRGLDAKIKEKNK